MDTKKALWSGRFSASPAEKMQSFSQSLDVDWQFYQEDIAGSRAHGAMLYKVGLLSSDEQEAIDRALHEIEKEIEKGEFIPDVALEDVHMNIEARLIEKLGPLGAKIHTGRSRNDQVATDYRLFMKKRVRELLSEHKQLLEVLLSRADQDIDVLMPGFTHMQHAQPISMGHFWMAYFWKFYRDLNRMTTALDAADQNPLGAGALAGTTLPIDRHITAQLLGFSSVTENSMDTVSDRDYLLEFLFAASTFMLHVSRLSEDLIIWNTSEYDFIELPDAFCTGSSMMPNKKNPDALELMRGKTSGVTAAMQDLMGNLKGLPLTYNRDLQEDKRPVFHALKTVGEVLGILPQLLSEIKIKKESIAPHLQKGFLLATDVAEYLVEKGVPFRETHHVVGHAVQRCLEKGTGFEGLTLDEWQAFHPVIQSDLFPRLTIESSVDRRKSFGGTARSEVRRQIESGRSSISRMTF
jgi:argininosuccinate lyase